MVITMAKLRMAHAWRTPAAWANMIEVTADFICGLHFDPSSFLENGRLKTKAIPSFFPSLVNLERDHPYSKKQVHADEQTDFEIGRFYVERLVLLKLPPSAQPGVCVW